jgi:S1-C subfamily serine protease
MPRIALVAVFSLILGSSSLPAQPPDDLESVQEHLMKEAVLLVANSVVQVETSGGAELVGPTGRGRQIRKGVGPTTGVIAGADGYVISSAFNFANKPSAIFVAVPGHKERYVATVVATDHSRMLTLLKINVQKLPVPTAVPKKEMHVGAWALALGRTWAGLDVPPSVSVGVVSALGRIWGKAIQTDAKVSPTNYGGPLIDIQGRVLGILVPAAPRGQDETAGVEWYDSGIGFAIPFEDVLAVLPQLKQGKDLNKGHLGIIVQSTDIYGAAPVIASVAPDSPAMRAGIKPGDTVVAIDGVPVTRQAQIMHLLGAKYDGDAVNVKVRRDKKELDFPGLKLAGTQSAHIHPFLGVLPMRDDPQPGEEVRYVFAKSPAEQAGLKAGDRILRWSLADAPLQPIINRDRFTNLLNVIPAGMVLNLEVKQKEGSKTKIFKPTLGVSSSEVPDQLPEPATFKKALPGKPGVPADPKGEKKKPATGTIKRTTPSGDHQYQVYVPADYDPNIAHALVVWLHPAGKPKEKDKETEQIISAWEDFCMDNHIILLCPRAESETGWLGSETDFIHEAIQAVLSEYTIDRERIVAHGMGNGGQMAFYLAFHARDLIRAVATTGASMNGQPKDNLANERLAFFIVAGGRDPMSPAIAETRDKLQEHKFPVVYREIPEMGNQYLDAVTLHDLVRWIDSLDRQ